MSRRWGSKSICSLRKPSVGAVFWLVWPNLRWWSGWLSFENVDKERATIFCRCHRYSLGQHITIGGIDIGCAVVGSRICWPRSPTAAGRLACIARLSGRNPGSSSGAGRFRIGTIAQGNAGCCLALWMCAPRRREGRWLPRPWPRCRPWRTRAVRCGRSGSRGSLVNGVFCRENGDRRSVGFASGRNAAPGRVNGACGGEG